MTDYRRDTQNSIQGGDTSVSFQNQSVWNGGVDNMELFCVLFVYLSLLFCSCFVVLCFLCFVVVLLL
jgi:hypothetical protein